MHPQAIHNNQMEHQDMGSSQTNSSIFKSTNRAGKIPKDIRPKPRYYTKDPKKRWEVYASRKSFRPTTMDF